MHSIRTSFVARNWRLGLWLIAALLLLPTIAGAISSRTLISPTGQAAGDYFGISAKNAGDVNGDGYPDLIVGAYAWNNFQGRAYVYFGGPAADTLADLVMTGEPGQTYFGYQVDTAGDFNGDGYSDVVVGAYNYNTQQGRVYVYYGGTAMDANVDLTITGPSSGVYFGWSLSHAGDLNADGYGDLIVGAHAYNANQGRAYVYYGSASPDPVPDVTMNGEFVGDRFGWSVSAAGDTDGDGYDDVVIGAYSYEPDGGRAYMYYGSPALGNWYHTITAPQQGTYFGWAVSDVGDMNGDGYADVAVGAFQYNSGTGRVYVFFGGKSVVFSSPDVILTGEWFGSYFGYSVSSAGDVNGDGYADLLVGSSFYPNGRAYVYLGGATVDNVPDLNLDGIPASGYGRPVAAAGDVDGDGFDDVLVSGYNYDASHGRVYVESIFPYQVVSPNGGEQWVSDKSAVVRWRGHDPADLAVSYDGGSSWTTLASGIGGEDDNSFVLTVPSTTTTHAMVRLSYAGQAVRHATSDVSDGVFRIVPSTTPPFAAHRLQLAPTGEATNDVFGIAAGAAGDVNGDGYADAIVGAYNNAGGRGRAYVYYGGPSADNVADLVLTGEVGSSYFGISAGTAGDVNGDGYADVIVGAYGYGGGAGRAYVYFGGPAPDSNPDMILTSPGGGGTYFGYSVSTAGDMNHDGYADVIVGAFGTNGGQGQAFVYFGGPTVDTAPDMTLIGITAGENFGTSVAAGGDVNGDGYPDVIVGAQAYNGNQGRAYVFFGGRIPDTTADLKLSGELVGSNFGACVGATDLNGDGYSDLAVGSIFAASGRGRVYVYYGGSAPDAAPDLVLTGEATPNYFGCSLGEAGDVNRDGYPDLVVGAYNWNGGYGRAYLFYGGPGVDSVPDVTFTGQTPSDVLGIVVAGAGDMNGDGYADLAISSYGYNNYQGRVAFHDFNRYFLTAPNGGETWNVGATKTVSWLGAEKADLWLSVDAGRSYDRIASGLGGAESNSWPLRVPHAPGKFSMIKVTPTQAAVPGFDRSDSTFTIQTSVALLALLAAPAPDRAGAAVISWNTDPGPADLAGYRLEKASGGSWQTLASLTRETHYVDDAAGEAGARYRLIAVNGLNEELVLGETSLAPRRPLSAWPVPYRGGNLTISFATASGLGGAAAQAEVSVFDVSGRLVRTVAKGLYGATYQTTVWDGRDATGNKVPAGIYFVRAASAGQVKTLKLALLR